MIAELLSHIIFTSSMLRVIPADASEPVVRLAAAPSLGFATLPRAADRKAGPRKVHVDSYGVVTRAQSAIVVDAASGAVLYSKNANDPRAIGSITKLMAVYTFLQTNPELNSKVTLVYDDYVAGGRVYLRFDDAVYVYDVLKASLIGSDNTATASLARLAGMTDDDFVAKMNVNAAALGMTSTHYADLSGVNASNTSTAFDLTKMLAAAEGNATMGNIMAMDAVTVSQASGYSVDIHATNELLDSFLNTDTYHIVAGKTGYIPQAGYCLATSVEHGKGRVRVVVLGAPTIGSRFVDAKGLAAWAFNTFSWE